MFEMIRAQKLLTVTLTSVAIACVCATARAHAQDIYFDVSLRETGTSTIHANVYENPAKRGNTTVLAVHGLSSTGATFKPLAKALFDDARLGRNVRRVVAIDLPGHGKSETPELPDGVRFGDLTIEDNVAVVKQTIDILCEKELGPQVIIGHSMGGLAVQAVQEALLAEHSSLAEHGVTTAVLLAGVPNSGAVWTQPPTPDLSPYIVMDDALGSYLELPPEVFVTSGNWQTFAGTNAANAPTAEEVAANGWVGVEPLTTLLQLGGTDTLVRPSARRNAFHSRHGTRLAVISFSQDVLVPAVAQGDLYRYLTGSSGPLYLPVVADDATHGMYVSNPKGVLKALRSSLP